MRVRDLLDMPALGLRLLTDVTGMDRPIQHVYTTDLPDPGRYLTAGDLVLTGMIWCRGPGDAERFVRALAKAGASVLAAGEALGQVPPEVIEACCRHGVALLAVPVETSFAAITNEVGRRLNGDRASAMTRVLGRRRLLLSAVAEGAGLDALFRLMGREIGTGCWLLTGTGRVVGGTGGSLSRAFAVRLAGEYVRADRLPATVRVDGPGSADGRYSLFGVGPEPRISNWFLACAGREQDWAHELRESVMELAADVALERARLDAARGGERKLAEAIVVPLASEGTAPGEIASLMRAAELPPGGSYLVAAMHAQAGRPSAAGLAAVTGLASVTGLAGANGLAGTGGSAGPSGVGHAGTGPGRWVADLAEELTLPWSEHAVVAPLGEEIIALMPLDPAPAGETGSQAENETGSQAENETESAAHLFAARLRESLPIFDADRSRVRLSVGVSAPADGVAGLAGALHEATSARRIAALRLDDVAVSVVTSDEVASHELLLATVPGSVLRSFRERLLGPVTDYDEGHKAELMPTLREFLACSGSWNACAARMYVHVNTVRYRIRRIEELTGRDLSSLDNRVDFFLALRIR